MPSVDLVHELTGKSEDQHGRPVEKDDSDKGIQGAVSASLQYFFDGQLQLSPTSPRIGSDRYEGLEEWKDLFLIKIATSQQ